jgi:hypothetical protein
LATQDKIRLLCLGQNLVTFVERAALRRSPNTGLTVLRA